jgi:hypothetical protein
MPFHVNKIVFREDPNNPDDYYAFEDMRGRLQPKQQQLEVAARRGHRGETLRETGIRAIPSQILTIHYVEDWTSAQNAITAYGDLIGALVQVIQHTTNYGYFKVLGPVVEVDARAVETVIGSLIATPTVLQVVQWTLISTDPPEEP